LPVQDGQEKAFHIGDLVSVTGKRWPLGPRYRWACGLIVSAKYTREPRLVKKTAQETARRRRRRSEKKANG
jgi:hypothetical protein